MELELNMSEKCNPIDIKVIGHNTQRLKPNVPYVTNLISAYDIIFLSEQWLFNSIQFNFFNSIYSCIAHFHGNTA